MSTTTLDLRGASVVITGGSDGIGRGLAARFVAAGSRVLVTGRDAGKLARAAAALPGLDTLVSDVGDAQARGALAARVAERGLDVLVLNAGGQRRVALAVDDAPWSEHQREVDSLLCGPVHLTQLLLPLLLRRERSLLVTVTSGGALVPQVFAPLYSACKAALRSYTRTLRHALADSGCRVVELMPPAVDTALAGGAARNHGVPLDAFCDAAFAALTSSDAGEIGYGPTATMGRAARDELEQLFVASAARFAVPTFGRR